MSRPAVPASVPVLSVIVAASDSAGAVARTLDAIDRQVGAGRVEVIVAATTDRIAPPEVGERALPDVRWVVAPPGTSVPRLRRLGFDRATAPLVVFTEDSCDFGPGWASAWISAFDDTRVRAASGTVEPAMGGAAMDWAVFFCEYAPFLPCGDTPSLGEANSECLGSSAASPQDPKPAPVLSSSLSLRERAGVRARGIRGCLRSRWDERRTRPETGSSSIPSPSVVTRLAGNNFAVRRAAVLDGPEIHETEVARAPAGSRIIVATEAQAWHVRRYAHREVIGDRLRFGYAYGQQRARSWGPMARLAGIFAGPAILGVQAARLSATVLAGRRHLGPFVAVLPITLALLAAWSVGEWLGWLRAGSSRARRRRGTAARIATRPTDRVGSRPAHCSSGPPAA